MTEFHPRHHHLTRIPFDTEFRISLPDSDAVYTGKVIDLSLKGALVQRPADITVDIG